VNSLNWGATNGGITEAAVLFGAIFLVALLALLWIAFFRKKRRQRKYHHRDYAKTKAPGEISESGKKVFRHHRRKHKHSENQPPFVT
jgi:hypothetical protein